MSDFWFSGFSRPVSVAILELSTARDELAPPIGAADNILGVDDA
ncbi:hypothetical protein [Cryobacterium sp. TMT1-19]|nr:hypothetical protein [Cryobacterium sp. TMT1-19]